MGLIFSVYGLLALVAGYLLGSIPFGLILTKAAGLGDVRNIGSGNIGATNVLRTGNTGLAAATLLLDALKGTAAVLLSAYLFVNTVGYPAPESMNIWSAVTTPGWALGAGGRITGAAALGAFLGHLFPVWLGFRGGKGVATYIGALLGIWFPAAIAFCLIWIGMAFVARRSSLSSLVAAVATPLLLSLVWMLHPMALLFVAMSALLIWKHSANIRRLMDGTEPKIGAKDKA